MADEGAEGFRMMGRNALQGLQQAPSGAYTSLRTTYTAFNQPHSGHCKGVSTRAGLQRGTGIRD